MVYMMTTSELVAGIVVCIIGFFLKKTMDELKEVQKLANETKNKLNLVELDNNSKYNNLNEKMDMLFDTMKDIMLEIKSLKRNDK